MKYKKTTRSFFFFNIVGKPSYSSVLTAFQSCGPWPYRSRLRRRRGVCWIGVPLGRYTGFPHIVERTHSSHSEFCDFVQSHSGTTHQLLYLYWWVRLGQYKKTLFINCARFYFALIAWRINCRTLFLQQLCFRAAHKGYGDQRKAQHRNVSVRYFPLKRANFISRPMFHGFDYAKWTW